MNKLSQRIMSVATAMSLLLTAFEARAAESTEMTWTRTWYDAVQLQWQPLTAGEPTEVGIDNWRPAFSYQLSHSNAYVFGNSVYCGYNTMCRYALDGTYLEAFNIPGLDDVWKTTTDGTYCYMIEFERRSIFVVDIEKHEIVRVIPTSKFIYFLQYLPWLDEGRGGFAVGDYHSLYFIDMKGTILDGSIDFTINMDGEVICQDITVIGKHLYALANSNTHNRVVYEYDLDLLDFTGKTFDLHDFVGEAGVEEVYYPRTITTYTGQDNQTYMMFVDYSGINFKATSVPVVTDAASDNVAGYNIYRGAEKLNTEPLSPYTYSFRDTAVPEQGTTYQYELRAVNAEGAETAVASAAVTLDDTRALPLVDDFDYAYPKFVEFHRFDKSYMEINCGDSSSAWSIQVNGNDGDHVIQYHHGYDLDFAQTVVSRPLKAGADDIVKIAFYYGGNSYMQGISEETMNVDVLVEGSEEWVNVGSVTYVAKYNTFYEALFDVTEAVQGKEFRFRLRASGVDGAPTAYNWQITRVAAWAFHNTSVAGQVTYAGQPLTAPVELTATMKEIGITFTTTTLADGTFAFDEIQSGDYQLTVARDGMTFSTEASIDADDNNFMVNVPGGRLTTSTSSVEATMGPRSERSFEITVANEGDASADVSVEFIPTGNVSTPEYGSIDARDQFAVKHSFDNNSGVSNPIVYLNGKFYQKGINYTSPELIEIDMQGNVVASRPLTYDTEGVSHSVSGIFASENQLYVYTAARAWSEPKVPAYIIPVDLENNVILDSQKIGIDLTLTAINSIAYDKRTEAFYVLSNNGLNRLNADGSINETIPMPALYRFFAFDNYSVGGPYVWLVKSNYSPAGFIFGKYSFETGTIVDSFDSANLSGSIFATGNNMLSPSSAAIQSSTEVVPGFQSLIFMQAYSSRSGQGGQQMFIIKLYPTETWLTLDENPITLEASQQGEVTFNLNTDGLADGDQKQCNIVISSNNLSEDVIVPVTLTYDVNAASDYPGATNLVAAVSDDNQAVQLTWDSAATANEVSRYVVKRNDTFYAESATAGFTDSTPLFGTQTYQVFTQYADGIEVASESVEIDFTGEQWGAAVRDLQVVTNENNVTLSWNITPAYRCGIYNDFQSETPFSIDPMEGWTYIDGDGAYTYSNSVIDYQHEGERMTAMIYCPDMTDPEDPDLAGEPDGSQMLMFTSGNIEQIVNDDWVISPELNFEGTLEVSFCLRTRNAGYGIEKLSVEYSMTDNNIESFQRATLIATNSAAWQYYSVEIPAGARYVALHYITQYIYQLFLDDLYIGQKGQYSPMVGYIVYRNGEKLNEYPMVMNSFDDLDLDFGTYTYTVETVYENGATGQATATVIIEDTGVANVAKAESVITVADGTLTVTGGFDHLTIATASGMVMAQHAATAADFSMSLADFAPGVYVITVQHDGTTQAAKVILTR
ncbi:MAG: choice-of-anchor J domain-containing protein [Muribaculaceae bacterium]